MAFQGKRLNLVLLRLSFILPSLTGCIPESNKTVMAIQPSSETAPPQSKWVISTLIGSGNQAQETIIANPVDVAVDQQGQYFISDSRNHQIFKVDAQGLITQYVGNGNPGFSGDGGRASRAQLKFPRGLACDQEGNLWIADTGNHRIRKVNKAGVISTENLNQYPYPALESPQDLAFNPNGDLLIAETEAGRIRKRTPKGQITLLLEPSSHPPKIKPTAITTDSDGNLWIADAEHHQVLKQHLTGQISVIAGTGTAGFSGDGGAATKSQLSQPSGIAVDAVGQVWISDTQNQRLRMVNRLGQISTTLAYNLTALHKLFSPQQLTLNTAGSLLIVDPGYALVHQYTTKPLSSFEFGLIGASLWAEREAGFTVLATGMNEKIPANQLKSPSSLALDSADNLFILDSGHQRIISMTPTKRLFAHNYSIGGFSQTRFGGIAANAKNELFVVNTENNQLLKLSITKFTDQIIQRKLLQINQLKQPMRVIVDSAQQLWVSGFKEIYLVDPNTGRQILRAGGGQIPFAEGMAATSIELKGVMDIAVDSTQQIYILERDNHRVLKVNQAGQISSFAGTGQPGFSGDGGPALLAQLNSPMGLGIDAQDQLYIADTENHVIRKIDREGTITTLAGNGQYGFSGDQGDPRQAQLDSPSDIVIAQNGLVYIADRGNHRIRRIEPVGFKGPQN